MTKIEAIDLLDNLIGMVDDNHDNDYDTALKMAIKALEYDDAKYHEEHGEVIVDKAVWEDAKRALEQEPSGDAVSRQTVLDYINRILNQGMGKKKSFEFIHKFVEKLPSVNSQPKGHWIVGRIFPTKVGDENLIEYRCSECDRMIRCTESQLVNYPYCHCGARMEGEKNE